jgi:hypothetical protein
MMPPVSRLLRPLVAPFLQFAAKLRSSHLLLVATLLFVADLLIPDVLPFVDEILLGLATLLLARRKTGG